MERRTQGKDRNYTVTELESYRERWRVGEKDFGKEQVLKRKRV